MSKVIIDTGVGLRVDDESFDAFSGTAGASLSPSGVSLIDGATTYPVVTTDGIVGAYVATMPEWGLRPGSADNQSAAFQAMVDTVSAAGGGVIFIPSHFGGTSGPYLVTNIVPRSNVTIVGDGRTTLMPSAGSTRGVFDNTDGTHVNGFRLENLILDGDGLAVTLLRILKKNTITYAWDNGGMFEVTALNASVGVHVEWPGRAYYVGGHIENCTRALNLVQEHFYLRDLTIWNCKEGVYCDSLLHTHWDHLVFGHGGSGVSSVAVLTPATGGPHIEQSRLVNCEVIDYDTAINARYVVDTEISGWRLKTIRQAGMSFDFSGACIFTRNRIFDVSASADNTYDGIRLYNSAAQIPSIFSNNIVRNGTAVRARYGIHIESGPVDTLGSGNHVRNPGTAGYRVAVGMSTNKFLPAGNIGTFSTY